MITETIPIVSNTDAAKDGYADGYCSYIHHIAKRIAVIAITAILIVIFSCSGGGEGEADTVAPTVNAYESNKTLIVEATDNSGKIKQTRIGVDLNENNAIEDNEKEDYTGPVPFSKFASKKGKTLTAQGFATDYDGNEGKSAEFTFTVPLETITATLSGVPASVQHDYSGASNITATIASSGAYSIAKLYATNSDGTGKELIGEATYASSDATQVPGNIKTVGAKKVFAELYDEYSNKIGETSATAVDGIDTDMDFPECTSELADPDYFEVDIGDNLWYNVVMNDANNDPLELLTRGNGDPNQTIPSSCFTITPDYANKVWKVKVATSTLISGNIYSIFHKARDTLNNKESGEEYIRVKVF